MDKVGFSGSRGAGILIRERTNTLRKKKGNNVAKTAIARWLLKVVYHVLKERRSYIASYRGIMNAGAALPFSLSL